MKPFHCNEYNYKFYTMKLKQEHFKRALEVFSAYSTLQQNFNENQEKLNQIASTQKALVERLEQIRESEQEWIRQISKEYDMTPEELTKEIGNFVLNEIRSQKIETI